MPVQGVIMRPGDELFVLDLVQRVSFPFCPLFVLREFHPYFLSDDLTSLVIWSYTPVVTVARAGWGLTFLSIKTQVLFLVLVIWVGKVSGLFTIVPFGIGPCFLLCYNLEPCVSPSLLDWSFPLFFPVIEKSSIRAAMP